MIVDNLKLITKKINILLLLIIIVAASLRIFQLGKRDLWADEVSSVFFAKNFSSMRFERYLANHPNMELYSYFTLLSQWRRLAGDSVFVMRLFSVIFGVFSVLLIYLIGNILFNRQVATIGSFILALSPFHIYYSQELRGGAFFTFLTLLIFYFFIQAVKKDKIHYWFCLTISSIMGIYTHIFTFLMLISQGVILFIKKEKILSKKWLICIIFVLISFYPWCINHFPNFKEIFLKSSPLPRPTLESILFTFENFNLGYNSTRVGYIISDVIFFSIFLFGLFLSFKRCASPIISLCIMLFLPLVTVFLISQGPQSYYIDRHLIYFTPFYYLIISSGINEFKTKVFNIGFLLVFILLSFSSLYNYFNDYLPSPVIHHYWHYIKRPVQPAVRFIERNFNEGDIIAHTCTSTYSPFFYYSSYPQYYFFIPAYLTDFTRENVLKAKEGGNTKIINLTSSFKQSDFKEIWLIAASWAREEGELDKNSLGVIKWLNNKYDLIYREWMDGILILLFRQKLVSKN